MNVGPIIKYYRTKKGWTQAELANKICSISHLSKIETNMYAANEETLALLLNKLELTLENERERMAGTGSKLQEFILSIFSLDHEQADQLYEELIQEQDYLASSDFVNLYHLYLYRYYCWKELEEEELRIHTMIQRIKTTFTNVEANIFTFFQAMTLVQQRNNEEAQKFFYDFLANPLPIGKYWLGEAYFQLANTHSKLNQPEAAFIYGRKSFDLFEEEANWKRQIHAQMILGINYMRLRLFSEAETLYKKLLRNTRLFFRDTYHPYVLVNYGVCLMHQKKYAEARGEIEKALKVLPSQTKKYTIALFCWIEIGWKAGLTNTEWNEKLKELHLLSLDLEDKLFFHFSVFYEKKQFSQQDAMEYAIKWLYPYLIKMKHYEKAEVIVKEITDYYSEQDDLIMTRHYYDEWRKLIDREKIYNENDL
ncbi:helix-turn-helix domain-containing protein [Jeotgalibacillus soli]|uniref:HTH cro/C1-type domain-containing protein n=1 Tax=Jeotgalibacillus soli TaxID=889306 RepID=A0A0C2W146_9BACL|nr:helix-turn-helix domain-containing protein [Jeotgalibacillus soli]KIL49868.1 hypothetical protein KP78_13360 [Jeotgalibacillus soli]